MTPGVSKSLTRSVLCTVAVTVPVVGNPSAVDQWQWFVTLPIASPGHGTAPTMDQAKARWRDFFMPL
jgi:hypothetical protein